MSMSAGHILSQYYARRMMILLAAFVLLLLLVLAGLAIGSSSLNLREIAGSLFGQSASTTSRIIWNIRFPRILSAVIAGMALSISGAGIQTVIRNPLGSPYTLGLSGAAAFGAAFAIVILGALSGENFGGNAYIITLSAFLFSILSALLITGFARWKGASPVTLIMAGIILTALFNAATSLLQYLSDDIELASIVSWMFGDLGKATWRKLIIQAAVTLPALGFFVLHSWNFNAMNTGDETAMSMGIRVNRLRMLTVMVAAVCSAVAVAFYGIIAFVGLVVPHIARWFLGNNEQFVIPGSALIGALFLLLSDIAARTLFAPVVLPVGIVTSFIGAPFFLYLLIRRTPV